MGLFKLIYARFLPMRFLYDPESVFRVLSVKKTNLADQKKLLKNATQTPHISTA